MVLAAAAVVVIWLVSCGALGVISIRWFERRLKDHSSWLAVGMSAISWTGMFALLNAAAQMVSGERTEMKYAFVLVLVSHLLAVTWRLVRTRSLTLVPVAAPR
jgi:hypothetical protein